MSDPRPIGMLDSGVGGLTVLKEVRRLLPRESIIYVADEGHMPYGPRPVKEIRALTERITQFLIEQQCKLVVIPCYTANSAALHYLRAAFPDLPIVGMEPAVKPAAERTLSGVIGVIATQTTSQGELLLSVIDRFANGVRVEAMACPDLVLLVERGAPDNSETRKIIARYLGPLKAAGIDKLVLACTHFPFLTRYLQEYLGPDIEIIDPAPAVARQVGRVLDQRHLADHSEAEATVRYYTSGDVAHFRDLLAILTGEHPADVHRMD